MPLSQKSKPYRSRIVLLCFVLIVVTACSHLQRMENRLPMADREFVQEVRYIITKAERKRYVSIPATERAEFRRDFWRRRDPSPDTERNEYREAYYDRVKQANRLFSSEGREGWLTDRGRVFVLLGPPDHRQVYPTGYSFYEPPVEIWRYGFFPIIFVDRYHLGKYEMVKGNAYYLNAVARSQILLNEPLEAIKKKAKLDFQLNTRPLENGKIKVIVKIPYRVLLFSRDGEQYRAELKVLAILTAKDDTEVWKKEHSYSITLTKEGLAELEQEYVVEFPADAGGAGKYNLTVRVANKGEKNLAERSMEVRVL